MKELFPGYNKRSEAETKNLWDHGLFTFDANVLLNQYRYSETTRDAILKLIERLDKRIFLTYQAALEFHRHRFDVINEQAKIYKDFPDGLKKIEDEFSQKKTHPFLKEKIQKKLTDVLKEVKENIKENEQYFLNLPHDDKIYMQLNTLFGKKITKQYDSNRLEEIYKEGAKRYEKKIPPGFEDEKEKADEKKFGDLIIWNQIIDKAIESKLPIIFVTDDNKSDWWWKQKNDQILGPHPQLVLEIKEKADVDFHMYSTERFIESGLNYFKQASKPKVVEEVKELKASDTKDQKKIEFELKRNEQTIKFLELAKKRILKNIEDMQNDDQFDEKRYESFLKNLVNLESQIAKRKGTNIILTGGEY